MKTLIDIDDKLKKKFKLKCVEKNLSMKQAIETLIKDFLDAFLGDIQKEYSDYFVLGNLAERPDKIRWFDPCAGGDAEHEMSYPFVINDSFQPECLDTMDIREDSKSSEIADYLQTDIKHRKYQAIITNPPFYLAKEIIEKALDDVDEGGVVIMLLRLNFFGSKERKKFLQENMPMFAYVHSKRIGFTEDGKTDSIEYMHAVWQKGNTPLFTKLRII